MSFPDKSTTKNFPKPYIDTASIEDPLMKRVDVHKGEIGSRSSGLPKGLENTGLSIEHVGGSSGSRNQ
jgi:hypothetical protein